MCQYCKKNIIFNCHNSVTTLYLVCHNIAGDIRPILSSNIGTVFQKQNSNNTDTMFDTTVSTILFKIVVC